jgi:hypothetical protein
MWFKNKLCELKDWILTTTITSQFRRIVWEKCWGVENSSSTKDESQNYSFALCISPYLILYGRIYSLMLRIVVTQLNLTGMPALAHWVFLFPYLHTHKQFSWQKEEAFHSREIIYTGKLVFVGLTGGGTCKLQREKAMVGICKITLFVDLHQKAFWDTRAFWVAPEIQILQCKCVLEVTTIIGT